MKNEIKAEAVPVQVGRIPDAIRFAPLRVKKVSGVYSVYTRDDRTPGTLNNFSLAECQFEDDATLFSAAPALLDALKEAAELVKLARQYFPKSIKNSDTFTLENTNATIGKAIALAGGDR